MKMLALFFMERVSGERYFFLYLLQRLFLIVVIKN